MPNFLKVFLAMFMTMFLTASAQAAVAFDGLTQAFTGTFELSAYYTAVEIIVVALAIIAAIGLGIKQFRRVG